MLEATIPLSVTAPQPAGPAVAEHHITFHDVLSAINPLQYLPVVGTIYRAVTGDQIPESLRRVGSILVSGLMGGPVGVAVNVATQAAEKITGIDLDQAGQKLLADHLPAKPPSGKPTPAAVPARAPAAGGDTPAPPVAQAATPWSPDQLATYGVSTTRNGILRLGDLSGADVLNSLELARLRMAHAAYGQAVRLAG